MKRAFTLLELSVAMAIAGIVTAAAMTATVSVQRSFTISRKRVQQSDDARITLEHVLNSVRLAGGGTVRPWQAVSVSCTDDPNFVMPPCGAKTGRLHTLELKPEGQGIILSVAGNTVTVAAVGGVCPLKAGPAVIVPNESFLAANGGATWRSGVCTLSAGCTCTLGAPGLLGYTPGPSIPNSQFVGGSISPGRISSFFVDPATNRLMLLKDLSRTGLGVITSFMPGVKGFDSRLGYDTNSDGTIDALQPGVLTSPATAPATLRIVRAGIALFAPMPDGRTIDAPFFEGRIGDPGEMILSLEGNALMRANGVFQ